MWQRLHHHRLYSWIIVLLIASLFSSTQDALAEELPRRGFMGTAVAPLSDSLRTVFDLPDSVGLEIQRIVPQSSAESADLHVGDVILAVDGTPVRETSQFVALVGQYRYGDNLTLDIQRDGQPLALTVALKEFPRETSPDFEIIYDAVEVDGHLRRIIVTRPAGEGPFPVVMMLGGIGCYSLDLPFNPDHSYLQILYELTRQGFATLRVEKSGMGDSQGPPCADVDFDTEVAGYLAGLHALDRFTFIDTDRVVLLGHSIGGIIAPVLANEYPVAAVIAIATVGTNWFEYELENSRRQRLLRGEDYVELERSLHEKEQALHELLIARRSPAAILSDNPEWAAYLDYPVHHSYMQQLAVLNLAELWRGVEAPVVLMYGTSDFVTSAAEHQYAADVINFYHPGQANYVEIPELDHYFRRAPDQRASQRNEITAEFHELARSQIVSWAKMLIE